MSKKIFNLAVGLAVFMVVSLTSFSDVLRVGASPVPHGDVLEYIKEDLAKEGVELKIVEFTDYVTPNLALDSGDLDANFFQHIPYMENFAKERNLKLKAVGEVLISPLGLYSKKIKDVKELKEGDTIAIPNDPTNAGRALILLHKNDVLKIKDPTNLLSTEFDIVENPKKLKILSIEAAQLPRTLDDVAASIVNGNFAFKANLSPKKDSIIIEGKDSYYGNVVAVREGDENKEDVIKLIKALQTDKVRKYIEEKYPNGEIIPAF